MSPQYLAAQMLDVLDMEEMTLTDLPVLPGMLAFVVGLQAQTSPEGTPFKFSSHPVLIGYTVQDKPGCGSFLRHNRKPQNIITGMILADAI